MSSNIILETKSGIAPLPAYAFPQISAAEIVNYLETKILGFRLYAHDFTKWTGVSAQDHYIRLRICLNENDIVAQSNKSGLLDQAIANVGGGLTFKDSVIKALDPFMYHDLENVKKNPETMQKLMAMGVYGDRLDELIRLSKLTYFPDYKVFGLCLKSEAIIADMLSDPTTGKPHGNLRITKVDGVNGDTFRWEVYIADGNEQRSSTELNLDAIFKGRDNA